MMRRGASDEGFTLLELMIAMIVGLMVLGVTYLILTSMSTSAKRIEIATQEDRSVSDSMLTLTRYLRELHSINHAEDNSIDFTADYNNDSVLDRFVIYIDSQNRLMEQVYNPLTNTLKFQRVLASNVRNKTEGRALFTYYKAINSPAYGDSGYTPPKDGERLTKTQLVTVELSLMNPKGPAHGVYRVKTEVYLRNKLY